MNRLKKVSDNKSAPFTRTLSELYTSATYIDPIDTTDDTTPTLLCIVEEKSNGDNIKIGMIAVMISTGQVIYDGM